MTGKCRTTIIGRSEGGKWRNGKWRTKFGGKWNTGKCRTNSALFEVRRRKMEDQKMEDQIWRKMEDRKMQDQLTHYTHKTLTVKNS